MNPLRETVSLGIAILAMAGLACVRPNHLLDVAPVNADRTIHVVVENPAGTAEKWEVRANGRLIREQVDGEPITIAHLPWPANGGMIPRTLHSAEMGGDGEPLDVLVLGEAIERGHTVRVRPIGLLRVLDRLERDDKILAVPDAGPFADIDDVDALVLAYPGVLEMLSTWVTQSRPGGATEVQGHARRAAATLLIADGVRAFDAALRDGTMPDWETR